MAKQKIKQETVEPLLHRVIDGATGSTMSIAELLRLCMRLGGALGNEDLVRWARQEASGYKSDTELPDYRVLATEVAGTFHGPFGSGIKNAPIPKSAIDKDHQDVLFNAYLMHPAGEYEHMVDRPDAKSDLLEIPWSADSIAYYQQREIYQGVSLSYASQRLSRTTLSGVLQTIRTRVLDFGLQIAEELNIDPNVAMDPKKVSGLKDVETDRVQHIFNTTINAASNVSLGNSGQQQLINVSQGDLASLTKALSEVGITKELIAELEAAIANDGTEESNELGPATSGWLHKISQMVKAGALELATGVTVAVVKASIAHFLGIKL